MAQLTKAEWEEKLRSWVPAWYFERGQVSTARIKALAAVLAAVEASAYAHLAATYIAESESGELELHASERNLTRLEDESDPILRLRTRTIVSSSNRPALKRIVDELLIRGECEIREDYDSGVFCDRGAYLDRGEIIFTAMIKNAFTILIQNQRPDARSFTDREYFVGRDSFTGEDTGSFDIMETIRVAVNQARAAGCLFRIVQLRSS